MEFVYPAKFEKADEGGYTVTFPDLKGAVTEGDTLQEALDMAQDCLCGVLLAYEENKWGFPKASDLTAFPANNQDEFINLVKADLSDYKKKVLEKPIKKTLYIPKGLNDEAEARGVNFSQILREALQNYLTE